MPWNYRIVRHKRLEGRPDFLAIHEVYFDPGQEDHPHSMTTDSVGPGADAEDDLGSIAEIRAALQRMLQALDKSILNAKDIGTKAEIEDL